MTTFNMPILKQGSKNSSVLVLQQYLESLGLFSGATSDIFSSRITDAVKVFQIHNNLNPDGIVGAKTWRALIASVNLPPDSAVSAQSTPRVDSRYQYITHKVESGDNLWILAQKYGTTVDDIKTASGIVSNYLTIGQVLTVPVLVASDTGSVNPAQVAPSQNPDTPVLHPPPTPTPPSGGNEYTVKSGDSLWILSKRFGTTIDAIKAASGITSDALSIGQRLVIPATGLSVNTSSPGGGASTTGTTTVGENYYVKSGDSLWILSKRFGTTIDAIKAASGITSDALSIGQRLVIPAAGLSVNTSYPGGGASTTGTTTIGENYYVKSGDSLWILSKRFGTTIDAIKAASGITSDALSIGQRLVIPIH